MRFLFLFIFSFSAFSYVDLSIQFSASKSESIADPNIEGDIISESQTISLGWAWYIWEYTALELNYSKSKYTQTNTRRQEVDTDFDLTKTVSVTETEVKGAGLRFSLAKRRAFLLPTFSFGYALLTTKGRTDYDFDILGTTGSNGYDIEEQTSSSSYVSAGLKFNITKLVGLQFSAKSVMEDFELKEIDRNITYLAGLSWIF